MHQPLEVVGGALAAYHTGGANYEPILRGPGVLLTELVVAELGDFVAAPFAGKMLADHGASVTKLELVGNGVPRQGDLSREYGPFPHGERHPERSGLFSYLNANKKGISLDPSSAYETALTKLLEPCDVILIDAYFQRHVPLLEDLRSFARDWVPEAVVVSMTPFGIDGPLASYHGHDLVCSAAGGISVGVGEPDRDPVALPFFQCDFQLGLSGAFAALMGVIGRAKAGGGQVIDVSEQEILAALHSAYFLPRYIFGGGIVGYRSGRVGGGTPYPDTVLPCEDGLIALNTPQREQWQRFIECMGSPRWAQLPRYQNRRAMQWEYKDEIDALVCEWLASRRKMDLFTEFVSRRLPYAPLMTGSDLLENDHLVSRGAIQTYTFSGGGKFRGPAAVHEVDGRRPSKARSAPTLGQDNSSEASKPSPVRSRNMASYRAGPADGSGPLTGIRVLDLGTAWAGGLAGRYLADFGADVIKVESRTFMDGSRKGRPIGVDDTSGGDEGKWPDMQPGFHVHSRNKRSITLNLKKHGALELFAQLIEKSDVLIHNFSPGVMDRLGLTSSFLLQTNPKLIVVGQSAAGTTGPLRDMIGYNSTIAALAGLAALVGYKGEEPIGRFQGLYCDVVSALTTAFGVLLGIIDREGTGKGHLIELSQWEAALALIALPLLQESIGDSRDREDAMFFPSRNFPCLGEDEWIGISVDVRSPEWAALCTIVGRPDLKPDNGNAKEEIEGLVEDWSSTRDAETATKELQAAGIPAYRVCNIENVYFDPQLNARDAFVDVEQPLVGIEPQPSVAWHLDKTPGSVRRAAPRLGEHTDEILMEVLDLSEEVVADLVRLGVVER